MSYFTDCHERAYVEGDPIATAESIAADIKLDVRQRAALFPLIVGQCELMERGRVRRVEQQATRNGRKVDPTGDRRQLLDETFVVGDGRRVRWGDATVGDHRSRVELLTKMRDGLDATIVRHLDAIAQIEQAAAGCLNDIYNSKVVAA